MAKYKLVARCNGDNQNDEVSLDDFDDKDFKEFEDGTIDPKKQEDLLNIAIDITGFEWWIEEDK
jgi:hypothetical protein